jgi:hypothetical protein
MRVLRIGPRGGKIVGYIRGDLRKHRLTDMGRTCVGEPARVAFAWKKISDMGNEYWGGLVRSGTLSLTDAWARHTHETMTTLARLLGFRYEVEGKQVKGRI